MRGISVLIAGAGLAGLSAARELRKRGAAVTVVDARDRVGGRVLTVREPFLRGEHAEAGADLIDESQTEICRLIADVGLRTATILPRGFTAVGRNGRPRRHAGLAGSREAAAAGSPRVLRQRTAMGWRCRSIARARIGRALAASNPRAEDAERCGDRAAWLFSGRPRRVVAACARRSVRRGRRSRRREDVPHHWRK